MRSGRIPHQSYSDLPNGPFRDVVKASHAEDFGPVLQLLAEKPELIQLAATKLSRAGVERLFEALKGKDGLRLKLMDAALASFGLSQRQLMELKPQLTLAEQTQLLNGVATAASRRLLEAAGFGQVDEPAQQVFGATIDRARIGWLASKEYPPSLAALIESQGFGVRIDEVRESRAGFLFEERTVVREQLEALDAAQRLALRDLFVRRPPHTALRKIQNDPAVKGPPTVDALLKIMSGALFGATPQVSRDSAARAYDHSHENRIPKNQHTRWEARLLESDANVRLADFSYKWRPILSAMSTAEVEVLRLDKNHRAFVFLGDALPDAQGKTPDSWEPNFAPAKTLLEKMGPAPFRELLELLTKFGAGDGPHGLLGIIKLPFKDTVAKIGIERFHVLLRVLAEDDASSAIRFVAKTGGIAALLEAARTRSEKQLRALLHEQPPAPPADREPPMELSVTLGAPVPTAQALIQSARGWRSEQSDAYGTKMAQVVAALKAKLDGGDVPSFRAALDFMSGAVKGVAAELELNQKAQEDDAWGRFRVPGETGRMSYAFGPQLAWAEKMLDGESHRLQSGKSIPLTITAKLPATTAWLHTQPQDFGPALDEADKLFARALKETDPKRLIPIVAELHWWGANIMPFRRGSAGAIDAITKALFANAGIHPGAWKPDASPDISAFVLSRADFVERYPTFFAS